MSRTRTALVESLARSLTRDTTTVGAVPVNRWAGPTVRPTPPRHALTCTHCGGPVNPYAPGGETTICQAVECFDAAVATQFAGVA
jgi:hypothetical protein